MLIFTAAGLVLAGDYSWQDQPAKVLPNGDLEWTPQAFEFRPGPVVKYIDFEGGDDANPGTKEKPWKHHPWDPNATQQSVSYMVPGTTYVFKGGVNYRGSLINDESAPPTQPTQLTCDPSWGDGQAMLYGSEVVTGWTQGTDRKDIPEAGKVWVAEVDYLTRRLWMIDGDGKVTRLKLARTPNWEISNPEDILGEWWTWQKGTTGPNPDDPDKKMILGTDPRLKEFSRDELEGAVIWTKWGFVMGTPIPTKIRGIDLKEGKVAFKGIWFGSNRAQNVSTGHRYYLENKPQFLDQAGEFWAEKANETSTRLYLRLPDGQDPNSVTMEAAKRYSQIESANLQNIEISNLGFRFNNRAWDYTLSWFFGKEVDPAAIRIQGTARNVTVKNCTFEYVFTAFEADANQTRNRIERLRLQDNDVKQIDNKGFIVKVGKNPDGAGPFGTDVKILRNRFAHIGMRTERTSNGATIDVHYPQTMEIAGNVIDRVTGPGVFVFGGKSSGADGEAPLTRYLIHHNKVTDSLLASSDWGGIETWQGGPQYVWNNISGNPGGYHNKKYDKFEGSRFGHAYYLDGGFKTYLFNNVAWGKNNDTEDKTLANTAGIQGIIGYQNTFLNNTIYKFRQGSRQQAPEAGRNKHLGNLFQDISQNVFTYNKSRGKEAADPNQMDVPDDEGSYAYHTMAWAHNVFYDITGRMGGFEEDGRWFEGVEAFSKALQQRGTLSTNIGIMAETPPLRDAENHDFRPAEGSAAIDYGCKTFVPWGLYGVVGEWPFTINREDPTNVIDEHWYMTTYFRSRKDYKNQPMYPLTGVNITAKNYVDGPLEDWTQGALAFNGKDQYLQLEHAKTVEPVSYGVKVKVPGGWAEAIYPNKVKPGESFKVQVKLTNKIDLGRQLLVQLGYTIPRAWGGIMDVSEPQTITGEGPYEFTIDTKVVEDLKSFVLIISYTKDGTRETAFRNATAGIKVAKDGESAEMQEKTFDRYGKQIVVKDDDLRSPQIYQSNFLIEAYVKVEPGAKGVIVQKWLDGGYMLKVDEEGKAYFRAGAGEKLDHNSPVLRSNTVVADGKWHHIIAESDRSAFRFRLYIDGKPDAIGPGIFTAHNCRNEGNLYVGGTPDGEHLKMTMEFLRISLGTLADAQTTVDELYTWQFDGPQFRDFTGISPTGKSRDAGAIEYQD
jgi:hypothetical protein